MNTRRYIPYRKAAISCIFCLLFRHTCFDDFLKNSDHFSKFSEECPKIVRIIEACHTNVSKQLLKIFERFPKITNDCRRLSRKIPMFRSYAKKFNYNLKVKHDISEGINVFTSEGHGKYASRVPDVVSYDFFCMWCIFQ